MRNKIFTKIIITTLLVAFLTFNVGKVTRVSAVGTTTAIAGTAFILTGAVYISYLALTNGEVALPLADDMHDWLGSIGRKVSQYPSGSEAYQDIYQGLLRDPTANVIDGVWTWTQDRLRSFINDFSDTRLIQDIVSYDMDLPVIQPTTNFDYSFTLTPYDYQIVTVFGSYGTSTTTLSALANTYTFDKATGPRFIGFYTGSDGSKHAFPSYGNHTYRNYLDSDGLYTVQELINGVWSNVTQVDICTRLKIDNYTYYYLYPYLDYPFNSTASGWRAMQGITQNPVSTRTAEPQCLDAVIYNSVTGEEIEVIPRESTEVVRTPQWLDPDNENRPIIPWIPIPDIPTGVPIPPGYTGPPQWGFPLAELLDLLEELAEGLIKIDAIARLINEFAGQHGNNYYLEYNDGDTNYYTYYQPTVFDNDTEYVTYNINVSEQEDVIPVDLNTISLYTQNRYLEQIKNSAIAGSSMLRDLAVFWYDVDPEVTYIVLGCCILVLIGAFTGKLGHS